MIKTIWITRTQPCADDSARLWQAQGFKTIVAPLLRVVNAPQKPAPPDPNALLVFTSKNAVFAYQTYGYKTGHKVITVGDASADAARAAGFQDVVSAQGCSEDVTALILKNIPKSTPIIHCAGRHIRGSIIEDLQAAGYTGQRDLYYQSEAVNLWPKIDYSAVSHIAFYSPLAARSFRELYMQDKTARALRDIHKRVFISISQATDAALGDLRAQARVIANLPNETAMLIKADLIAP